MSEYFRKKLEEGSSTNNTKEDSVEKIQKKLRQSEEKAKMEREELMRLYRRNLKELLEEERNLLSIYRFTSGFADNLGFTDDAAGLRGIELDISEHTTELRIIMDRLGISYERLRP